MKHGKAFDENEQTRDEAFRFLTISATLLQDPSNQPAVELSNFFHDCMPVMLRYLRSAVEEGNVSVGTMDNFAVGLFREAVEYYGENVILATGHSPLPETMFWFWQYSRKEDPDAGHLLDKIERDIRKFCAHCRADLPEGKKSCCVECKAAYYCNRDCQVAHWKAGHKKDCVKKLKKKLKAAGTPFIEP